MDGRTDGGKGRGRPRPGVKPTWDVHIPSSRACVDERATDSSLLVCEARRGANNAAFKTEGEKWTELEMGRKLSRCSTMILDCGMQSGCKE